MFPASIIIRTNLAMEGYIGPAKTSFKVSGSPGEVRRRRSWGKVGFASRRVGFYLRSPVLYLLYGPGLKSDVQTTAKSMTGLMSLRAYDGFDSFEFGPLRPSLIGVRMLTGRTVGAAS